MLTIVLNILVIAYLLMAAWTVRYLRALGWAIEGNWRTRALMRLALALMGLAWPLLGAAMVRARKALD